jgi:hypothetical protein
LGGASVPKHAIIPGLTGEPIGLPARVLCALRGDTNCRAIQGLSRFSAYRAHPDRGGSESRFAPRPS